MSVQNSIAADQIVNTKNQNCCCTIFLIGDYHWLAFQIAHLRITELRNTLIYLVQTSNHSNTPVTGSNLSVHFYHWMICNLITITTRSSTLLQGPYVQNSVTAITGHRL